MYYVEKGNMERKREEENKETNEKENKMEDVEEEAKVVSWNKWKMEFDESTEIIPYESEVKSKKPEFKNGLLPSEYLDVSKHSLSPLASRFLPVIKDKKSPVDKENADFLSDLNKQFKDGTKIENKPKVKENKPKRNDSCMCGSGKKFKNCCLSKTKFA